MKWLLILLLLSAPALARDNGQWSSQPAATREWFNGLKNNIGGLCCSFTDGWTIEDADWDTQGDHYRVRVEGNWIDVPKEAVVIVPNQVGHAIVWPVKGADGKISIRCFMPGTEG